VHTKHLFNYILNLSLRTSGAHCNLATQTLYGSKLNQPFTFKPLVRHKHLTDVTPHLKSIWTAADHMADVFLARLPSLGLAIIVFFLFYGGSLWISRLILRATATRRHNVGVVFARLVSAAVVFLGLLVSFSIVAPSLQAADLIKVLGIGSVAIGFAFQNILQNFLAGLLLLWTEPFRVGDQIRLDAFEGTVEEIETRATTIKTYDGKRVIIPNADLFTRSVTINTAFDARRFEAEVAVKSSQKDLSGLKARIVDAVRQSKGVLPEPSPEALVVDLGDAGGDSIKIRVTWWTSPRQHQMLTTYDHVLTAIRQVLTDVVPQQAPAKLSRVS
jgi:small conductance mechanosensitive channel